MGKQLILQPWGRWTRRQIVRGASRSLAGPQPTQQGGWVPAPTALLAPVAQSSEELQPSSGKWGEGKHFTGRSPMKGQELVLVKC